MASRQQELISMGGDNISKNFKLAIQVISMICMSGTLALEAGQTKIFFKTKQVRTCFRFMLITIIMTGTTDDSSFSRASLAA